MMAVYIIAQPLEICAAWIFPSPNLFIMTLKFHYLLLFGVCSCPNVETKI